MVEDVARGPRIHAVLDNQQADQQEAVVWKLKVNYSPNFCID